MLDFSLDFLTLIRDELLQAGFRYTHITCWLWTASFTSLADDGACTIEFTCFSCPAWKWTICVPAPASLESIHATLEHYLYFTPDCDCIRQPPAADNSPHAINTHVNLI
jgi:hypothetical protein